MPKYAPCALRAQKAPAKPVSVRIEIIARPAWAQKAAGEINETSARLGGSSIVDYIDEPALERGRCRYPEAAASAYDASLDDIEAFLMQPK